jgi:uncharacterized membrane protein
MEMLDLLLAGALLVLFVSLGAVRARVSRLEARLDEMADGGLSVEVVPAPGRATAAEPEPVILSQFVIPAESGPRLEAEPPETPRAGREPRPAESLGGLFERLVGGRLLIWVGGAALVLSAVFLIRYSIEIGLVTPGLRMAGAAVLGLIFLAAGEYARAGRLADDPRIAQVLAGAGLATLYATAYGSHVLYALIGTGAASAAMVAITLAALAMSLRHGAPTAIMGLVGGFLTPLLVGDPDSGAVPLLAYVALLDIALFALAWRRGWTWLAAAAVVLSFAWTGFLTAQPRADALAAGGFIVLLAVAASLVRPGEGRQLSLIQPLAIGLLQLSLLVARVDLGIEAWALFGALGAASLALALLRPGQRFAPALALLLALLLLLAKAAAGVDPAVPWAGIGIGLLFGGGGLALSLARGGPLWTAIGCAGLAGPALILRAARPELLDRPAWGALMAALAAGAASTIWANRARATGGPPADLALLVGGSALALLAGASVFDLASAELVAAGWLVVALGIAYWARRMGDLALASAACVAAMVAIARAVWTVPELSVAALTGLVGEPVLAADLPDARTALWALALPALLLAALRLAMPPLPLGGRRALPAVAGLFAAAAAYVWFKQGFGLASPEDFAARGLIERTIITQALFAAGWLLGAGIVRLPGIAPDAARAAGTALTAVAAARLIWFDMAVYNPAWTEQYVGTAPVLNLILPAYLLSAFWLYAARRRAEAATRSGFWLAAFLAALIAGVGLMVRQAFQGPVLTGDEMPIAEFYGYSLAGLAVAIALLIAGIRLPDKALRLAGLLLLTATIFKVFLIDASALEGVLRILSFLGLGVALIGIGRLYGPVLRAERAQD